MIYLQLGHLGDQIRANREARGWTQAELGRRVGVSGETIAKWEESAFANHPISGLQRIASAFDVDLEIRFGTLKDLLESLGRPLVVPRFDEDPGLTQLLTEQDGGEDA